jgi:hypothetical protein
MSSTIYTLTRTEHTSRIGVAFGMPTVWVADARDNTRFVLARRSPA